MNTPSAIESTPNALKKAVALYQRDIDDVEKLRNHFQLDSFSQAMRRAIRIAMESVEINDSENVSAA